jgi:hypothetical protein
MQLMMGMDLQWCPKFNNLKFLSLDNWYLDANFYELIAFLQNSPNLEHLTLNLKLKQVHSSLHMYILIISKLYVCTMQVKLVCFFCL